jgi:cathepsin B
MKIFAFVALLAATQAAIHEFRAESHFICEMCRTTVGFIGDKRNDEGFKLCEDPTGKEYTNVCSQVLARQHRVKKWIEAGIMTQEICSRLHMCPSELINVIDERWNRPAINLSLIEEVNAHKEWVSGINSRFMGMSLEQVRQQLGAVVDPKHTYKLPALKYTKSDYDALPTDFDTRTQWPNCASVSGDIRDQSACGSCWAFGSTEAFNDRKCIASNGQDTTLLSPADTNSCCNIVRCGSMGCNGGQPTAAWHWFSTVGVVTGGDYPDNGKTDTCEPYTFPACAHHVTSPDYKPCPQNEYPTPSCKRACTNTGYSKGFDADKNKASQAYSLRTVNDAMVDMQKYGSATVAFTVYEDFLTYKSGVYTHKSGQALGGHAVKFLGWGVENGTPYWLVANSWNNEWGDKGTFKILRGQDECGIESDMSAGQA